MTRLFVANPTRQRQVIYYRLDVDSEGKTKDTNRRFEPARQQDIEPGRQVQLGTDFHMSQIDHIVEQMQPYGMIGVVDIPRLKAADLSNLRAGVVPYIFNVDRPVPAEAMRKVQAHNSSTLIEDGRERRKKAAVASNSIIQNTVENQFAQNGIEDSPSGRVDVSFEQEEQSDQGERTIAEGYRVSPTAPTQAPPKNKGGRPRKN